MYDSDVICVYSSKDGTKRFEVQRKKDRAQQLYLDLLGIGCQWTFKSEFEGLFFFEDKLGGIRKFLRKIGTAFRAAFEIGDPIIRIDGYVDDDARCIVFSDLRGWMAPLYNPVGYLTIRRDWWHEAMPLDPCTAESCRRYLEEEFEDAINRDLNHELFEVRFVDDITGEDFSFGEFLSWEDAELEASWRFPKCTVVVLYPFGDYPSNLNDSVEYDFDEDEWAREQYDRWMERLESGSCQNGKSHEERFDPLFEKLSKKMAEYGFSVR